MVLGRRQRSPSARGREACSSVRGRSSRPVRRASKLTALVREHRRAVSSDEPGISVWKGSAVLKEKLKRGSEGTMTSKASPGSPPDLAGSASGGMTLLQSRKIRGRLCTGSKGAGPGRFQAHG
jgi:hypothetical protein